MKLTILSLAFYWIMTPILHADDGYRLWLKYDKINNESLVAAYRQQIQSIWIVGGSPTGQVIREELEMASKATKDNFSEPSGS